MTEEELVQRIAELEAEQPNIRDLLKQWRAQRCDGHANRERHWQAMFMSGHPIWTELTFNLYLEEELTQNPILDRPE